MVDLQAMLSAISWDPQIRGAVIVLAGIILLPGSVYMLLATNMGAKLGLVLALTGLAGWMTIMGAVWLVFGIGLKGEEPSWTPLEAITGPSSQSLLPVMGDFPRGWKELPAGDPILADAQATADRVLAPSTDAGGGEHGGSEGEGGGEPEGAAARFESPFKATEDYVLLDGYRFGGEDYFLTLRHRPHYVVVRVKPVLFEDPPAGLRPQPDLAAPTTSIVMIRDLGNLRLPPFMVMFASGVIFGVCCWNLHQRDKEIMRARAATATA